MELDSNIQWRAKEIAKLEEELAKLRKADELDAWRISYLQSVR